MNGAIGQRLDAVLRLLLNDSTSEHPKAGDTTTVAFMESSGVVDRGDAHPMRQSTLSRIKENVMKLLVMGAAVMVAFWTAPPVQATLGDDTADTTCRALGNNLTGNATNDAAVFAKIARGLADVYVTSMQAGMEIESYQIKTYCPQYVVYLRRAAGE
jgi:hypothetical protein